METTQLFELVSQGQAEELQARLAAQPALAASRNEKGLGLGMFALYHNKPDCARTIAAHLAEADVHEAAALGLTARLSTLLAADPGLANRLSADGGTPLGFAAFFAQPESVRILLTAGADVEGICPGFNQVRPVHAASAGRSLEIVSMLLDAGADPNSLQHMGYTGLMTAAGNGDRRICEQLIAAGASTGLRCEAGQSAADLARQRGHSGLADWLESLVTAQAAG